MSEGSPTGPIPPSEIVTDPTAVIGAVATQKGAGEPEAPVDQEGKTVDEVETIWKNRVAGKDRAHAAEATALRSERDTLTQRLASIEQERATQQQANLSEADRWKAKAEEAERLVVKEREQRVIDLRTVKYGAAAEHLDAAALAAMDEGKLAALNARLVGDDAPEPSGGPIDPNQAPKRTAAPPSSLAEKTVDDLKSDLQKYESEFIGTLNIPGSAG